MLDHQASTLQKMKARTIEQQWRDDKRSFRKSMNKAAERKEDDIPFAVDMADYPFILKQKVNSSKGLISLKKSRKEFVPPIDINQEIYKLSKSLSSLRTADSAELTPITKQKLLKDEIDKISDLQDEIQNLQYYNTFTLTPFN